MRAVEAERLRQEAEKLAEQERIRKGKSQFTWISVILKLKLTRPIFRLFGLPLETTKRFSVKEINLYVSFNLVFQRKLLKLKKRERRRRKKNGLVRRQRRKPRRSDLKKKNRKNFKNKSNKKDWRKKKKNGRRNKKLFRRQLKKKLLKLHK